MSKRRRGRRGGKKFFEAQFAEPIQEGRDPETGVEVALVGKSTGTKEALQHRPIFKAETDQGTRAVRAATTLDILLQKKQISRRQYLAGRYFQEQFDKARLDPLRAPDLGRVAGGGGPGDPTTEQINAKRELFKMLDHVGGMSSPGGNIAWDILGRGLSLRDLENCKISKNSSIRRDTAKGILICVLSIWVANRYQASL